MIITCPACATRYEVDDARFSAGGRSVRCAECAESWYVPAPEPVENLALRRTRAQPEEGPARRDDAYEEELEEPLFDAPARTRARDFAGERGAPAPERSQDDAPPEAGNYGERADFQPRRESEERCERDGDERARGAGAMGGRDGRSWRASVRKNLDERVYEAPKPPRDFSGAPDDSFFPGPRANGSSRGRDEARAAAVDADFEDVGAAFGDFPPGPTERGFGRRIRQERRHAAALARMDDLEPIAERVFSEEFFKALRVQPKELERAIRKARRRAEARDKNRLTPLRALGWSAWIGAIGACLFVAYAYRDGIVAMFPNAGDAYRAVGIEADPYGLKIEGLTHRLAMSAEGPAIEILGRLRNDSAGRVAPPMLQAEALGADGEVLTRWTFAAPAAELGEGESVSFSTRAHVPEGVAEVLLAFAPAEGVKVSVGDLLKTPPEPDGR